MERTGVSRTPVREGLRTLEGEGLVITYRSRGTFVTYRLTPDEALLHLRRAAGARAAPDGARRRADDARGAWRWCEEFLARLRGRARQRRAARGRAARRRLPPDDLRGERQRVAERAARLLDAAPARAVRARLQHRGPAALPGRAPVRSSRRSRTATAPWPQKRMRSHIEHGTLGAREARRACATHG